MGGGGGGGGGGEGEGRLEPIRNTTNIFHSAIHIFLKLLH